MKKYLFALLAFLLVACSAPAPTQATVPSAVPPTQVPPTAEVIVQTVVVTVVPTQAPTDVPTNTPVPPPTSEPATQAPASTVAVVPPVEAGNGLIKIDDNLGAGWFVNMTRTRNDFSLRCQLNKEITFSVKSADTNITEVNFYYRTEDRKTGAVFEWQNAGRMIPDASGNFTLVFSGENVNADLRKPNSWFDYQFVGVSKSGGRVGNSEKIVQQVTYTFDCP